MRSNLESEAGDLGRVLENSALATPRSCWKAGDFRRSSARRRPSLAGGHAGGEMDAGDDAVQADLATSGEDAVFLTGGELNEDCGPENSACGVEAGVGICGGEGDYRMDGGVLKRRTGTLPKVLGGGGDGMGVVRGVIEEGEGQGQFIGTKPRSEDAGEGGGSEVFLGAGAGDLDGRAGFLAREDGLDVGSVFRRAGRGRAREEGGEADGIGRKVVAGGGRLGEQGAGPENRSSARAMREGFMAARLKDEG